MSTTTLQPTKPKTTHPPRPDLKIDLQVEHRIDREVPSWSAYLFKGTGDPRLVACLNTSHPLTARALKAADTETLEWLISIPLSEQLLVRQRDDLIFAALSRIKRLLIPPEKHNVHGVMFLASALGSSQPMQIAIRELLKSKGNLCRPLPITVVKTSESE